MGGTVILFDIVTITSTLNLDKTIKFEFLSIILWTEDLNVVTVTRSNSLLPLIKRQEISFSRNKTEKRSSLDQSCFLIESRINAG